MPTSLVNAATDLCLTRDGSDTLVVANCDYSYSQEFSFVLDGPNPTIQQETNSGPYAMFGNLQVTLFPSDQERTGVKFGSGFNRGFGSAPAIFEFGWGPSHRGRMAYLRHLVLIVVLSVLFFQRRIFEYLRPGKNFAPNLAFLLCTNGAVTPRVLEISLSFFCGTSGDLWSCPNNNCR